MEVDEEAQIPVEWVDADEWETLEQALAAATSKDDQLKTSDSHFAGDDAIGVGCTRNEGSTSSVAVAREYEQKSALQGPCLGSMASQMDVEALASGGTGAAMLSKHQLDALNTDLEKVDVGSEMVLEKLNQVMDDRPERTRRTLPAWSQKTEVKPVVVQTNLRQLTDSWSMARPACKDKVQSKPLCLQFKGQLVYSKTYLEVDAAVHDIWEIINAKRSISPGNVAVGFDLEWKASFQRGVASGKVAVIQLCPEASRCDVMHIVHSGIPPSLATFLKDSSILKTGIGSYGDALKLQKDYGIQTRGVVDLSEMANQKLGIGWLSSKQWSLSSLAQELTCKKVDKVPSIRTGDWEACPLSAPQLQYAATDAFASLYLYQILETFSNRVLKNEESSNDSPLLQQGLT